MLMQVPNVFVMIFVCKSPKANYKVFHSPIDGVSKRMRERPREFEDEFV